ARFEGGGDDASVIDDGASAGANGTAGAFGSAAFDVLNRDDAHLHMSRRRRMRTPVAVIGGGAPRVLLSHILPPNGLDSVVLERQTRQHVLHRIRAGALEAGTVELLRAVGLGDRMDREGHPHDGSAIVWEGRERFFIDTKKHTGKRMMAYGQTAITEDLYAARDAAGGQIIDEAGNVQLHDLTSARPHVTYEKNGQAHRVDCEYVAGCDGYHGASRQAIPVSLLRTFEKTYPFGWLGIMAETPP